MPLSLLNLKSGAFLRPLFTGLKGLSERQFEWNSHLPYFHVIFLHWAKLWFCVQVQLLNVCIVFNIYQRFSGYNMVRHFQHWVD